MNSVCEIVHCESILMQCGFQAQLYYKKKNNCEHINEGVVFLKSVVHVNIKIVKGYKRWWFTYQRGRFSSCWSCFHHLLHWSCWTGLR